MSSVNKVILLGRLGQDPELKNTPSGQSVCNFSIATTESWNDKSSGQKQERTEWHRVVVWGKLAEISNQYLAKGRQAYVEGKIQTRSWEDDKGNKRYSTEILAKDIVFVGSNSEKNDALKDAHNKNESGDYNVKTDANFASDDIPF
jgi:single-strand DNA-binding protein